MKKRILINISGSETRIASTLDDKLTSLSVEHRDQTNRVGNIYQGKVTRVLPGIQSAFIDIGLERAAFLYGDDAQKSPDGQKTIDELVKEGDSITVQITKESLGSKGVRVTTRLGLAGRYIVFLPDRAEVNISKKISDNDERQRLLEIANETIQKNHGMIIRTAAHSKSAEQIQNDYNNLLSTWKSIHKNLRQKNKTQLIHKEHNLPLKIIRDRFDSSISEIIVDHADTHNRLQVFLRDQMPQAYDRLQFYQEKELLFDKYGIESQIEKAMRRKVWLPSGGYLIVERTEALTVFDVNSGKYVGENDANTTIVNTNLEAAIEIAAQLELRNIGGIIVVDFIDMDHKSDQTKVYDALQSRLELDHAKTNLIGFSELGLVQLTRQRNHDSWVRTVSTKCRACGGSGRVLSIDAHVNHLLRDLHRHLLNTDKDNVTVHTREDIKDVVMKRYKNALRDLEENFSTTILIESNDTPTPEQTHSSYTIS